MADTTLSIGVVAELKEFERQMATLPGIGAKEARDMVTGIRSQLKQAEKAAKDSAGKVSGAFSGEFNKISSGAAALSAQIGGSFGRIGSVVNSAIKPLTEAGVGFGVAAAAAAEIGMAVAGIEAVVNGAIDLASAANAAAVELQTMGFSVSADAQKDLARYTEGTKDLKVAFDELKVSAGAPVAGEIGVLSRALSDQLQPGVVDNLRAWNDWGDTVVNRVAPGIAFVRDLIRGGESSLYHALTDTARAEVDAEANLDHLNDGLEATKELIDQIRGDYGPSLEQLLGKGTSPNHATDDAAKAAQKAAQEMAKLQQQESALEQEQQKHISATQQLQQVYDSLHKTQLGPSEQIQADLDAQLEKITELGEKAGEAGQQLAQEAAQAAADIAANKQTQFADEQKYSLERAAKYWDDYSDQVKRDAALVTETVEDNARKQKQAMLKAGVEEALAIAQTTANIAGSWADLEGSIVDGFQARVDAGEQLSRKEVQQANNAIEAAEAAQIAQAGITAAITTASGIASLQTAGVPPPIAIPLGVAEGAGLFAATVAGIRQHRPVDFSWTPHYEHGGQQGGYTNATDYENSLHGTAPGTSNNSKPSIPTDGGDDSGVGMHQKGSGSSARVRHNGMTFEVRVSGGRPGKLGPRGGRA